MRILHLISSAAGENSSSSRLSTALVEKIKATALDSKVIVKNFSTSPLPHFGEAELHTLTYGTPDDSPPSKEALLRSDNAIAELRDADVVVIGIPMYNFGIPSTLKAWIDHISIAGKTFNYTENGPVGLLGNKKIYLSISSGGIYTHGSMAAMDYTENYLRAFLGFIGFHDVTAFRVEGNGIPGIKETALDEAIKKISELNF